MRIPLTETVAKLEYLMSVVDITHTRAFDIVERNKLNAFKHHIIKRPKPEDVTIMKFDKYYEPFIVAEGEFTVLYKRTRTYAVQVDDHVVEVEIMGNKLKPIKSLPPHMGIWERFFRRKKDYVRVIALEGRETLEMKTKGYVILDRKGNEYPYSLPHVELSPLREDFVQREPERYLRLEVYPDKAVETLRRRLVKVPPDAEEVISANLRVHTFQVIYYPAYYAELYWKENDEVRIARVDGSTGKIEFYPSK